MDGKKEEETVMSESKGVTYTDVEAKAEQKRIVKNIIIISIAFLFNFNAFNGLARLQSSLHKDKGMGVINQSIVYGALVVSCLFLPKPIISLIGHKWTIPLSFSGYILWMAANGYAVWGTMIPASIFVGICAAPLWTAQCSYFTKIAKRYAKLSRENEAAVISRFFGIFFFTFQISAITGSIISATILRPAAENGSEIWEPDDLTLDTCGANDCPWVEANSTSPQPDTDTKTVWTMVGVYIGIALLAVLIVCLFVENLPSELREPRTGVTKEVLQLALATVKHLRHKPQLLLIPLTMYSGFEQAFYNAEFTLSFVTCPIGIWKVGMVTLPFGIVNVLVSFGSGHAIKYVGRIPVFLAGMCVDLCIQLTLLMWLPSPREEYVLYILAGMWGFTDGIWQTQINALYGVVFSSSSEAAFSNYRMWESVGFIIAFASSNFICTDHKIYILLSVLLLGIACYLVVEWMEWKHKTADFSNDLAPEDSKQTTRGSAKSDEILPSGIRMLDGIYAYNNPNYNMDSNDTILSNHI